MTVVTKIWYFLRSKKVGTFDWARKFTADASLTSRAKARFVSLAMAYRPWALAGATQRRPFVDTGCLVVIRRKLPSDQVTVDCGSVPTFWNGGSTFLLKLTPSSPHPANVPFVPDSVSSIGSGRLTDLTVSVVSKDPLVWKNSEFDKKPEVA